MFHPAATPTNPTAAAHDATAPVEAIVVMLRRVADCKAAEAESPRDLPAPPALT